jgi:hypothetical protein
MSDSTTPSRPAQSFWALNRQRLLEAQRSQAALFRARLLEAAGIDSDSLSPRPSGRSTG